MRTITDHKVNGLNEAIEINVMDEPGPGGANHLYRIELRPEGLPSWVGAMITFQNGPITGFVDMNGITNEALLAVLIDRMRGFQYARKEDGAFDFEILGKYACDENEMALMHMREALFWLQKRTRERMAREVEGTMQR